MDSLNLVQDIRIIRELLNMTAKEPDGETG